MLGDCIRGELGQYEKEVSEYVYVLPGTDLYLWNKEQLGAAMGKEFRASLAVLDEGFSKTIMKELEKEKGKE